MEFAVYKHYIKSVGTVLASATLFLNFAFQAFQIGSNIWLTQWSDDKLVSNDTGLRDMYLGVYGAFGAGQGEVVIVDVGPINQSINQLHFSPPSSRMHTKNLMSILIVWLMN